jgi:hypothetical protein
MKDAIVFSTWNWDTFNVPERVALALCLRGCRVLYCEMPVSRFRRRGKNLREIQPGIHAFGPEYLGEKFTDFSGVRDWQWRMVARQIRRHSHSLGMKNPRFFYSHIEGIAALCREMRGHGSELVHICMDYPESYQYELVEISDRTLVIPPTVYQKLRARYGEKIDSIPQSIHLPDEREDRKKTMPPELADVPRPRLGYLGEIHARVNVPLIQRLLEERTGWHFVCFGDASALPLPNVHALRWRSASELPALVEGLDAGVMPYDCFEEKNLHCVPLKLFDYFLAGLPVVSTPVLSLSEYSELIYFGDTAVEFEQAVEAALAEPPTSPKRRRRVEVARAHSTEALGLRLDELLRPATSCKRDSG